MTPDISEFSYGFALTHELIGSIRSPLRAAPVFPSLIEEGRPGGGYDVHLDWPGFPMFLQFKRSDYMTRRNAREIQDGIPLNLPFYRIRIAERHRSAQHDLLLALDTGVNEVFYAAPRFHRLRELDAEYAASNVADRSLFIRPRDIGLLDDQPHSVAFDDRRVYLRSEPREMSFLGGEGFWSALEERLTTDKRPLRDGVLKEALVTIEKALNETGLPTRVRRDPGMRSKTPESHQLRKLADLSLRYFGAQFFVVQRAGHE